MTDLEQICENALYDEVRVLEDGKSVVRDIPTGRLYFKKRLDVYNEQVFAYLRDHKNRHVTAVQAFWKEGEELIVIEELVQGRTLEEVITSRTSDPTEEPLTFAEKIDILSQICDGLQFLHSADPPIIHRDIKASNIMITDDGVVKIIDYDAAKIYITGQKKDTVMIGTQGLAAPEQYGFAQSDVRTDLYALGKLVERMLPDNVDAKRIADKATEMDPKRRYISAEQMKGQIRRIREHTSKLDQRFEKIPGFDPMNRSHRIRARIGLALGSVALIALIILAGWRLFVYPKIVSEELRAEIAVIAEADTSDKDLINAIETFAASHSYNDLNTEQQRIVRDAVEDAVKRSFLGGKTEDASEIRDIVIRYYGNEALWESVFEYGEADYNLEKGNFEDALSSLSDLIKSGAIDAGEHWEAAVNLTLTAAREKTAAFMDNGNRTDLMSGVNAYAALIKYGAEISGTDLQQELDGKKAEILEKAKQCRTDKQWDEAIKIYENLQSAGIGDQTELISETQYEKAEALQADESYEKAAAIFADLGDYKDAEEKKKECLYQKGCVEKENGSYAAAVSTFATIPGYKDADNLALEAKYAHCENTKDDPKTSTYQYIEELVEADYEGAGDLREEIYKWHVSLSNGVLYSLGSMQAAYVKAKLTGGPPDGSAVIKFEFYDFTSGDTDTWTDGKEYKSGETAEVTYSEEDSRFNLFDRMYRVRVYVDGELAETWEGQFEQ